MGSRLDRERRGPRAVESLEGRSLLSPLAQPPGSGHPAREVLTPSDGGPREIQPSIATGDRGDQSRAGREMLDGHDARSASGASGPAQPSGAGEGCDPGTSEPDRGGGAHALGVGGHRRPGAALGDLAGGARRGESPSGVAPAPSGPVEEVAANPPAGGPSRDPGAPDPVDGDAGGSSARVASDDRVGGDPAPGPVARSSGLLRTSRVDSEGADRPEGAGLPDSDGSGRLATPRPPAAPGLPIAGAPPAAEPGDPSNGQGMPAGPPGSPAGVAAVAPDPRSFADVPLESSRQDLGGGPPGPEDPAGAGSSTPAPRPAGLITSLLPLGRSSLESAIDRLLEPIDGLGSALPEVGGPVKALAASLAAATAVLAVEVALRRRRPEAGGLEGDGDELLGPFPGLPGPRRWSRP